MVDGGYSCINRGTNCSSSYPQILTSVPITASGNISSWCVYGVSSGTISLRIYRLNGSNYEYIGGSSAKSFSSGLNTFSADIDVQSGDFVGYYQDGGSLSCETPSYENIRYKDYDVDITSTTPTSDWSSSPMYVVSMGITLSVAPTIYAQVNIGDSWKDVTDMKINIGDSWKDVVGIQQNIGDTWKTVL